MPSTGWLAALARHFGKTSPSRTDSPSPTAASSRGWQDTHRTWQDADGGVAGLTAGTVIDVECAASRTPPSRPTTPWSLDMLEHDNSESRKLEEDLQKFEEELHSSAEAVFRALPKSFPPPPLSRANSENLQIMRDAAREQASLEEAASPTTGRWSRVSGTSTLSLGSSSYPRQRPSSAASRLSAPAAPLMRTHVHGHSEVSPKGSKIPLPAQVDIPDSPRQEAARGRLLDLGAAVLDHPLLAASLRGQYVIPPVIQPLYDRQLAAPTPTSSTRCNTPVWDLDGEKRVRFLEPEVVGDKTSRASSVASQYSNVVKNSARFALNHPNGGSEMQGHNPRFCSCPCHFLPAARSSITSSTATATTPTAADGPQRRHSVGVQVQRLPRGDGDDNEDDDEEEELITTKAYRLYLIPSTKGLQDAGFLGKTFAMLMRALLSQLGLAIVVVAWWVVGAVVLAAVEGPPERTTRENMAAFRNDLVIELATELRQVRPYDWVWRAKIEAYMERLEAKVLEAARAGYVSRAPTWTMTGALLYSASLTTLIGPGGMVVRTGFSRVFTVLFTVVGAPLVLMVVLSAARTFHLGLGRLWSWRCGCGKGGCGRVFNKQPHQYSDRAASAISTLEPSSIPPPPPPPESSEEIRREHQRSLSQGAYSLPDTFSPRLESSKSSSFGGTSAVSASASSGNRVTPAQGSLTQTKRVPDMDTTLRDHKRSRGRHRTPSSSAGSSTSPEMYGSDDSGNARGGGQRRRRRQTGLNGHRQPEEQQHHQQEEEQLQIQNILPPEGSVPIDRNIFPQIIYCRNAARIPWYFYFAILVLYILLGFIIFAPILRWDVATAIYVLLSTLLTTDHSCLGDRLWVGVNKMVIPYIIYMFFGVIVLLAFLLSVWSRITRGLVNVGRYLRVVEPVYR